MKITQQQINDLQKMWSTLDQLEGEFYKHTEWPGTGFNSKKGYQKHFWLSCISTRLEHFNNLVNHTLSNMQK